MWFDPRDPLVSKHYGDASLKPRYTPRDGASTPLAYVPYDDLQPSPSPHMGDLTITSEPKLEEHLAVCVRTYALPAPLAWVHLRERFNGESMKLEWCLWITGPEWAVEER